MEVKKRVLKKKSENTIITHLSKGTESDERKENNNPTINIISTQSQTPIQTSKNRLNSQMLEVLNSCHEKCSRQNIDIDSDDEDDDKSVFDVDINNMRKKEAKEEEEDERTPFQIWKDNLHIKFSCELHILESEDMEKEDINVQKFYVNFNIIKNTIQELYTSAKEYKELDFNGKTSTYSIQKNTYDLNIQKSKAYLELIKEETNGKLLTTREDKKAKKEYNLTMKELNGYKPFQENYKFEKIIKYRKYLIQLIDEKKKYLLKEFNIRYDPFFNRFYD